MKKIFKKALTVAGSALMVGSTIGLAAAAAYPSPFVSGGTANVAVVYSGSSDAALSDGVAAVNIAADLAGSISGSANGGSDITISGEAAPLFTSSSPLFLNDTIDNVKTTLTSSNLPTVLADGTFETTSNIGYTQRIQVGSRQIDFAQQPSDSDDPQVGITLGTNAKSGYVYNATVIFDENVNFTTSDSTGTTIDLFGKQYTVGGATTSSKLVLLSSSQTINLRSDESTSTTVTVDGEEYTIELVAATDDDARIKVTDSTGTSDTKTVTEDNSKTIRGIEVGLTYANEDTARNLVQADITVGSDRITLQDGQAVKEGTDEDIIDGTNVEFENSGGTEVTSTETIGKIIFQVAAEDSQTDAIIEGESFIDPIFGSIKTDFTGLTIPLDSSDREEIRVENSGNDKMTLTMQSHDGSEAKTITWVKNNTAAMALADGDRDLFVVEEMGAVNQSGYVILANDKEGGLYEISQITNSSSTTASDDSITFRNVFTGESKTFKADTEGSVTVTLQGKSYTVTYTGASTISNSKAMTARVNYPESSSDMILFPTVKTDKGAKIAFYQPTTVTLNAWDGANSLSGQSIQFPDGDGYTSATFTDVGNETGDENAEWNVTGAGTGQISTDAGDGAASVALTIDKLSYNVTSTGTNSTVKIYLTSPEGGNIVRPALIMFEEKDDQNNYEAAIVTLDAGYNGDSAGIGVSDIVRTWGNDADLGNEVQLESDSDLYQDIDFFGTLFELDKSDSDQVSARISYPENQVEAKVYIAEESASITSDGTSTSGSAGVLTITDDEVASASGMSLIVVGGSCINSVAADLLGEEACGADFTALTDVSDGEFLIESFNRDGETALLVAGYNAADTTKAATYLQNNDVDSAVGNKYIGTSATEASLVVA